MRRALLVWSVLVLSTSVAGCSECFYALVGEHVRSSHQDGGVVGGIRPMHLNGSTGAGNTLQSNLVSEFRFEKEWDGSYATHVLGGFRLEDKRLNWPMFYEVQGGWTHYPSENLFTLHPNLGFIIPSHSDKYQFIARVGLPVYFFSGNTEVGTEFTFGLNVPQPRWHK